MNKYIDAELLREEINKKITEREKELKSFSDEDYICSVASDIACRKRGYLDIIELLDSLQQEQPDKETILRICKLYKVWSIIAPWENVEDFVTTNWNSENIV